MGEVQKIYLLVSTFPLTQKSLLCFDHEKNGQGQTQRKRETGSNCGTQMEEAKYL